MIFCFLFCLLSNLIHPVVLYVKEEKQAGQRDSDGKWRRDSSQKKEKFCMFFNCSAVRSAEATVRTEIGMSASSVKDVPLYDCWMSVWRDGSRVFAFFYSVADTKPWC